MCIHLSLNQEHTSLSERKWSGVARRLFHLHICTWLSQNVSHYFSCHYIMECGHQWKGVIADFHTCIICILWVVGQICIVYFVYVSFTFKNHPSSSFNIPLDIHIDILSSSTMSGLPSSFLSLNESYLPLCKEHFLLSYCIGMGENWAAQTRTTLVSCMWEFFFPSGSLLL